MARFGTVWRGKAWYGPAWLGRVYRSFIQMILWRDKMYDVETIFESPFSSETTMPEPEWEKDYIPEYPPWFDLDEDAAATEALLYSLGVV